MGWPLQIEKTDREYMIGSGLNRPWRNEVQREGRTAARQQKVKKSNTSKFIIAFFFLNKPNDIAKELLLLKKREMHLVL